MISKPEDDGTQMKHTMIRQRNNLGLQIQRSLSSTPILTMYFDALTLRIGVLWEERKSFPASLYRAFSQPSVSVGSKNVDAFEVPGRHAVGNG